MSCNSEILTVSNTNQQVTTSGGQFVPMPLGAVIRRFGPSLALENGSVTACGSGYYSCDASITVSPVSAGAVTAQLYRDGLPVPGAIATGTAASAGDQVALPLVTTIRNCGCDCRSTLSIGVNASCTVDNLSFRVRKD